MSNYGTEQFIKIKTFISFPNGPDKKLEIEFFIQNPSLFNEYKPMLEITGYDRCREQSTVIVPFKDICHVIEYFKKKDKRLAIKALQGSAKMRR